MASGLPGASYPVSIHAPRCRGAMPGGKQLHPGRAGFNPRPPLPRGDADCRNRRRAYNPGFNPRPPLPRGDAAALADGAGWSVVSIHAPRCRGAMR